MDVYPWDICYVTANHLNWKPRFVIQSYVSLLSGPRPKICRGLPGQRCAAVHPLLPSGDLDINIPASSSSTTRMEIYRWYDVVDQSRTFRSCNTAISPRWDRSDELGSKVITFGQRWEVPEGVQGPVILRATCG